MFFLRKPPPEDEPLKDYEFGVPLSASRGTERQSQTPMGYWDLLRLTGIGPYNLWLLLVMVPNQLALMYQLYTMSYVVPVAKCALQLDEFMHGLLYVSNILGMLMTAWCWTTVGRRYGRRKIIIICFVILLLVRLGESVCDSFGCYFFTELMGGTVAVGPVMIYMNMLMEYHNHIYHGFVMKVQVVVYGLSNLFIATLALFILPRDDVKVEMLLMPHQWNIFILISIFPCVLGIIMHSTISDTPRYFFSKQKYHKGLLLLKKMHRRNRIQTLFPDINTVQVSMYPRPSSLTEAFNDSCYKVKYIKGHKRALVMCAFVQAFSMSGSYTLRLWLVYTLGYVGELKENKSSYSGGMICNWINSDDQSKCWTIEQATLAYLTTVGIISFLLVVDIIIAFCLDRAKKRVLAATLSAISTLVAIGMFFSFHTLMFNILVTIYISFMLNNTLVAMSLTMDRVQYEVHEITLNSTTAVARIMTIVQALLFKAIASTSCLFMFLQLIILALLALLFVFLIGKAPTREQVAHEREWIDADKQRRLAEKNLEDKRKSGSKKNSKLTETVMHPF